MIEKQDISVLLLYYLGYSKIRNLIFRMKCKPITRFVTFHNILPESTRIFKTNLEFLKQRTHVVSLEEFFEGQLSVSKINTVITFDDGYKSWTSIAVPILKNLGLPATFFVSSGFVGLSEEEESEYLKSNLLIKNGSRRIFGGLSKEDLRYIVENGFTIGGHTENHANLGELMDKNKAKDEIIKDKIRLEKTTGKKIDYFAYPLGSYFNPQINLVNLLKEAGYKGAVTTVSGFNSIESNPYLLHRELTRASMPGQVFIARIFGNYDAVRFIKERILKVLHILKIKVF